MFYKKNTFLLEWSWDKHFEMINSREPMLDFCISNTAQMLSAQTTYSEQVFILPADQSCAVQHTAKLNFLMHFSIAYNI